MKHGVKTKSQTVWVESLRTCILRQFHRSCKQLMGWTHWRRVVVFGWRAGRREQRSQRQKTREPSRASSRVESEFSGKKDLRKEGPDNCPLAKSSIGRFPPPNTFSIKGTLPSPLPLSPLLQTHVHPQGSGSKSDFF